LLQEEFSHVENDFWIESEEEVTHH
jgi:hypothetical protein